MEFRAIVSPTITELFRSQIEEMIFRGELKSGDHLPTERELAESMKISKSIVHAGIRDLERDGFLTVVPRKGTYVADYARDGNVSTLTALLRYHGGILDEKTTRSMLETRAAVSGLAMELLAERKTENDLNRLREDIEAFHTAFEEQNREEMLRVNYGFHLDIAVLSGNNILPMLLNSFKDVSELMWKSWLDRFGPEETESCMRQYTDLIAAGDGAGARRCFEHQCARYAEQVLRT